MRAALPVAGMLLGLITTIGKIWDTATTAAVEILKNFVPLTILFIFLTSFVDYVQRPQPLYYYPVELMYDFCSFYIGLLTPVNPNILQSLIGIPIIGGILPAIAQTQPFQWLLLSVYIIKILLFLHHTKEILTLIWSWYAAAGLFQK
jgi:hypothetical protein